MHEFEYKGWKYRLVSVEEATVELISAGKLIGKVVVPEEVECQDKKYKVIAIRGERYDKAHIEYPSDKRRKPIVSYTTITNPVFIGQALHSVQEKLEVVLPSSLKTIGNFAFYDCSNLTSVTLSDGIISIDECAFCKCSNLTSVTIPNGVTYIGKSAFAKCSNLTSVTIPNSVTSIGQCCFLDCSNLTSVTIPNGVTYIEKMIFSNCRSLTSITIPNSVTGIDFWAFERCVALTSITIPHSVTWIHKDAFDGCRGVIVTIENDEGKVRSQNASLSSAKIHYVGKPKEQHVMPTPKEAAAPTEAPKVEPTPAPVTPVATQPTEAPKPSAPTINLETLIAAALADGVVTDKERAILCKKVKDAGGDVDEFEMLLDARIYEAQQKNQTSASTEVVNQPAIHSIEKKTQEEVNTSNVATPEQPKSEASTISEARKRDKADYLFNGKVYTKKVQLVHDLVLHHLSLHPNLTHEQLKQDFYCQKNMDVMFMSYEMYLSTLAEKGIVYFYGDKTEKDTIALKDAKILISSNWPTMVGGKPSVFAKLIEKVKELGYEITVQE